MGLISKIKAVLGVSSNGQERSRDRPTAATAEGEPEASSERAVKGVDQASDSGPQGAGVGASAGEAEGVSTEAEGVSTEADDASTDADEDADGNGDAGNEPARATGEPVESIKGIGSAYAQRLADAGVHSVSELAQADPAELATATDLGTGRVGKWVERAKARTE